MESYPLKLIVQESCKLEHNMYELWPCASSYNHPQMSEVRIHNIMTYDRGPEAMTEAVNTTLDID